MRLRMAGGDTAMFWFSRRLTRGLLPELVKLLGSAVLAVDESSRRELLAFDHRKTVDAAEFGEAFKPGSRDVYPEGPVLVAQVKLHVLGEDRGWRIELNGADGRSASLNADRTTLHSLIKLFNDLLPKTGWGLDLAEVQGATDSSGQLKH